MPNFNNRRQYPKESFGIACCRFNNGKYELLVIKKKHTYNYNIFVSGRYDNSIVQQNSQYFIKLFSGMTMEEKLDIRSLDFNKMWYRLRLNNYPSMYYSAESKFKINFLTDDGYKLKKLLKQSDRIRLSWEIPKGRKKNRQESDISCAIREFTEETGISYKRIRVYPGVKIVKQYEDGGVKYTENYYLAMCTGKINPKIDVTSDEQCTEISDIDWMSIDKIRMNDENNRLTKLAERAIKNAKYQRKLHG